VFVKIVGALTTFLVARILSPGDYGIWVTLLVIGSFSSILCLGTVEALIKLYPFLAGRGNLEEAKAVESGVLGSIILASALLCVAGAVFPIFAVNPGIAAITRLVQIVAAATAFSIFSAFFYHRFMAHQDFRHVSIIDSLRSVTFFLLIVPLSWKWGLTGAAWAIFFNEIVVLSYSLYVNIKILGAVRPTFSPLILRRLISVGFPITVIWWTYMLQTTVDRLLSMWMLGKEATGFYGLGASIVAALVLIPMVVGRVLYPKVNEEIGKNADRSTLEAYVVAPAQALALVLPPLIGVLIILVPDLYGIVFVKYLPGARSAQILLAGAYFACLIRSGVNYLVAIDKQNGVLAIVGASLAVNVALSFLLVKAGLGINGIAMGMTISCMALTSLLWKSVFVQLGLSGRSQALRLFHLYLPFLICLVVAGSLAAARYWTKSISSLPLDLAGAAIFVVAYGTAIFFVPPLDTWSRDITSRIRPVLVSTRKKLGMLAAR